MYDCVEYDMLNMVLDIYLQERIALPIALCLDYLEDLTNITRASIQLFSIR